MARNARQICIAQPHGSGCVGVARVLAQDRYPRTFVGVVYHNSRMAMRRRHRRRVGRLRSTLCYGGKGWGSDVWAVQECVLTYLARAAG